MSGAESRAKKLSTIQKLYEKLSNHNQVILVNLMNVGSNQVQQIRKLLAEKNAELMIGKNTVFRKAITLRSKELDQNMEEYEFYAQFGEPKPQLEALNNLMKGKVGLIFTDEPVFEIKPIIESNKVQTAARVGIVAPCDVVVPPGPTGMDPSQISFFHALHITTKIQKGQIEILKDVVVCQKGEVVGNSEASLLQKLGIKPFLYGMEMLKVYDDGNVIDPEVVCQTTEQLLAKFTNGVNNIAGLSMALGFVNQLSVPHMLSNAFKNLAGLSLATGYKLTALDSLQQASASAPAQGATETKQVVQAAEEEEEEEEEVDMGGLFDM